MACRAFLRGPFAQRQLLRSSSRNFWRDWVGSSPRFHSTTKAPQNSSQIFPSNSRISPSINSPTSSSTYHLRTHLKPFVISRNRQSYEQTSTSRRPPAKLSERKEELEKPSKFTWSFLNADSDVRKLIALAAPAKEYIFYGLLFLPIATGAVLIFPYKMGEIIDGVVGANASPETVRNTIGLLLGVFSVGAVATFGRAYFFNLAGEKVGVSIRKHLFSKLFDTELAFFDQNRVGDLITRLASDTTTIASAMTENISVGVRSIVQVVFGAGFLCWTSWKLALVSSCTILPLVALTRIYGKVLKKTSKQQADVFGKASAIADEIITNIRTVLLFSREDVAKRKFEEQVDETFKIGKYLALLRAGWMSITTLLASLSGLAVMGAGSYLVAAGELTVGELTSFLLYTTYVGGSLISLSYVYSGMMRALGANQRIQEVSNYYKRPETSGKILENVMGHISFKNVMFHYPTRPEVTIFNDLNLEFEAGKTVAVIGTSGTGKSSLLVLLARFYEIQSGEILVDGENIKNLDLKWLREKIGVVSQESNLFYGTIRENIAFGKLEATQEEIENAARQANAHDFIMAFPNGYDTFVGEHGVTLSGGQKQRLCIARAVLKEPKILILDEASSNLDAVSEKLVHEALDRLMEGRTVIFITHRLSTINSADYIVVLDKGRVIEQGTKAQLMEGDTVLKSFLKHQISIEN